MADFNPSGSQNPEPILMKLGMVDYIRDPTRHDNFGGGSAAWVVWANMWLVTSLEFLFFLFLLSSARAQVAFLDWSARSIHQNAFSARDVPFGGLNNMPLHLWGQNPPKNSPKWAVIGISQPMGKAVKKPYIGHQWRYTRHISHRFSTGGTIEKVQNYTKWNREGGHVTYFWNFGTLSISRERLKLETSNFACIYITAGSNEQNAKLGQKGREGVTW